MFAIKPLIRSLTPPVLYAGAASLIGRSKKVPLIVDVPPAAIPIVAGEPPTIAMDESPTIVADVHGVPIRMERGHALPHYVASHPLYDSAIGYIVKHLRDRAARPVIVIDVGANIGDTACLAARLVANDDVEFICVEGSEDFLDLLRENTRALRAEIVHAIAGESTAAANKKVVTLDVGTSFVADGGSSYETTLDGIVRGRHIDLIKVDTDGYEMQVIRGSKETIKRCSPDLFLEYAPHHIRTYGKTEPRDILKELVSIGYEHALAYDNLGHAIGVLPLLGEALDVLTTYSESRSGFYLDMHLSKDSASLRDFAAGEMIRTNTATLSGY